MKVIKVIEELRFKTCLARKEIVEAPDGSEHEWKAAYSIIDGSYIGNLKNAETFERKGIVPQAHSGNKVASIGFCEKEQKWYGWSHRAMYGFSVGSESKQGKIGFQPSNKEEFMESLERWYNDDLYKNIKLTHTKEGVSVYYEIHQKGTGKIIKNNFVDKYPDTWGRGEWTAKTLDDAREMAINFAREVS
jgi:hypothetical protein